MHISIIEFGSPDFIELLSLRDLVLRKPLNMEFTIDQISEEYNSFHFGAYDDQQNLLATLILKPINSTILKIRQVAVHPSAQKKGIGKLIVAASEDYARYHNYSEIVLNARDTAVPFYKRLDYQVIGDVFQEVGIDHLQMRKIL